MRPLGLVQGFLLASGAYILSYLSTQVRSPTCRDPKVSVHPSVHLCPAAPDYGMGRSPLPVLPPRGISYRGDWAFSLIYLGSRNTFKVDGKSYRFLPVVISGALLHLSSGLWTRVRILWALSPL